MSRRFYSASDIRMLTACDVIADHALENLDTLEAYNSEWNTEYFTEIKLQISDALQNIFGIRSVSALKEITARITAMQAVILTHLTMIRRQIVTAWRNEPERSHAILTDLGFTAFWKGAKTNSSIADLISLLKTFDKATDGSLVEELKAHRISIKSIEFVCSNIIPLYDLNVQQEGAKDSRKIITAEIIDKFNKIYTETMFYAGTAQILFKGNKVLVKEFTFTHIIRNIGGSSTRSSSEDTIVPVEPLE